MMRLSVLTSILPAVLAVPAWSLTGEQILARMDINRNYTTVSSEAVMEIHVGNEVRTKTMVIKGMSEGKKSIVEFTNPEDRGTRYLMLGDNLWIYFPEEEEVVKISGHMLKEGMMGSDLSYEDALESDILTKKYRITLAGEEKCAEKECFVVELEAISRDAPYHRRRMWVDKESFVAWKEEMYARSGKLLKEANVLEVKLIGTRYYPVKSEMVNRLRKDSRTIFIMGDIVLDEPMDAEEFGMRYLRR